MAAKRVTSRSKPPRTPEPPSLDTKPSRPVRYHDDSKGPTIFYIQGSGDGVTGHLDEWSVDLVTALGDDGSVGSVIGDVHTLVTKRFTKKKGKAKKAAAKKGSKGSKRTIHRSSVTGRIVTKKYAKKHPKTTETERVKTSRKKSKKK